VTFSLIAALAIDPSVATATKALISLYLFMKSIDS
jgi:hypothetical protein